MLVEAQRQLYITIRYTGGQFNLDDMNRVIITNGFDKGTNKQNVSIGISGKKHVEDLEIEGKMNLKRITWTHDMRCEGDLTAQRRSSVLTN